MWATQQTGKKVGFPLAVAFRSLTEAHAPPQHTLKETFRTLFVEHSRLVAQGWQLEIRSDSSIAWRGMIGNEKWIVSTSRPDLGVTDVTMKRVEKPNGPHASVNLGDVADLISAHNPETPKKELFRLQSHTDQKIRETAATTLRATLTSNTSPRYPEHRTCPRLGGYWSTLPGGTWVVTAPFEKAYVPLEVAAFLSAAQVMEEVQEEHLYNMHRKFTDLGWYVVWQPRSTETVFGWHTPKSGRDTEKTVGLYHVEASVEEVFVSVNGHKDWLSYEETIPFVFAASYESTEEQYHWAALCGSTLTQETLLKNPYVPKRLRTVAQLSRNSAA